MSHTSWENVKVFVVVIPEEGLVPGAPPILLWVWHWLQHIIIESRREQFYSWRHTHRRIGRALARLSFFEYDNDCFLVTHAMYAPRSRVGYFYSPFDQIMLFCDVHVLHTCVKCVTYIARVLCPCHSKESQLSRTVHNYTLCTPEPLLMTVHNTLLSPWSQN